MQEHITVGREYPDIDLNTSYSFGLDDQEFVVAANRLEKAEEEIGCLHAAFAFCFRGEDDGGIERDDAGGQFGCRVGIGERAADRNPDQPARQT